MLAQIELWANNAPGIAFLPILFRGAGLGRQRFHAGTAGEVQVGVQPGELRNQALGNNERACKKAGRMQIGGYSNTVLFNPPALRRQLIFLLLAR